MSKTLTLNVYEYPTLDFAEWSKTPAYHDKGLHFLKDGSSYLKLGMSQFFLSAQESANLSRNIKSEEPEKSTPAPTIGISEETLLAALAIAQDAKLAPQLLALRKQ